MMLSIATIITALVSLFGLVLAFRSVLRVGRSYYPNSRNVAEDKQGDALLAAAGFVVFIAFGIIAGVMALAAS